LSIILKESGAVEKDQKAKNEILKLTAPNVWNLNIKDNAEYEIEKGFEQFMFVVREHTNENLDTITTFRFYSLLEHIKKKNNGR
tara:strand:- start:1810 stop:2061 length:252 start_codon:yes stop_codon:yes gene_type:complete